MSEATLPSDFPQLLRMDQVERVTGMNRRAVYRAMSLKQFPKAVKLFAGSRTVGWRAADVRAWIESRAAA